MFVTANRLIFYLTAVSLLTISASRVRALNPAEEPLKSEILQGIELTINNRFEQAAELYRNVTRQYPDHPIGYFYQGANLQARMLDAEDFSREAEFYRLMDRTVACADSLERSGATDDDAWNAFYKGSAYLYRSFMKSKRGDWLSAYRDAKNGVHTLEKAIARDSSLYDAYLGVGSFKYWKSARADFLLWLPIISDERAEGIRMVRQSIRRGDFVYWIGRDQLCWILLDKGNYREALQIARENSAAFPQSRFFKWTLVSAAEKSGDYEQAYRLYAGLLNEIRRMPENNHYNELECLLGMAKIDVRKENWEQAYQLSDAALRLKLEKKIRKRAKNRLEKALDIRRRAADKMKNNDGDE